MTDLPLTQGPQRSRHAAWDDPTPPGFAAAAIFTLLVLLAFGRALRFGFATDDYEFLHGLGEWSVAGASTPLYWRPLWSLWLSAQYSLFGANPRPMHVASIGLHLINSLLAYRLLAAIRIDPRVAFGAVCVWTLMAGNAHAIVWISQSNDLLAMMFLLVASHAWVRVCTARGPSLGYAAVGVASWFAAMTAKEVGLLWPVAAAIAAFVAVRGRTEPGGRRAGYLAAALPLVALGAYALVKMAVQGPTGGFNLHATANSQLRASPMRTVLVGKAIHYVEGICYTLLPVDYFRSWGGMAGGLAIAALLAGIALYRLRGVPRPLALQVAAGVAWLLAFTAHATVVPAPRTLYIPTLGTATILGCLVLTPGQGRGRRVGFAALAALLAIHACLGQTVVDELSPTGWFTTVGAARRLKAGGAIEPVARAQMEAQLRYMNIDALAAQDPEPPSLWRSFVKDLFRSTFQKGQSRSAPADRGAQMKGKLGAAAVPRVRDATPDGI